MISEASVSTLPGASRSLSDPSSSDENASSSGFQGTCPVCHVTCHSMLAERGSSAAETKTIGATGCLGRGEFHHQSSASNGCPARLTSRLTLTPSTPRVRQPTLAASTRCFQRLSQLCSAIQTTPPSIQPFHRPSAAAITILLTCCKLRATSRGKFAGMGRASEQGTSGICPAM